ncbi:hypothetical protein DDD_1893 [Nonlabens dokdonensis DSW-6]|uniref:Uncharacterized protein n=1 Tax=Nonlabens dokdonensis (strain DSM 17205 / KCTC 12402 / DSW-6) TaxID=592029 RepID=L7W5S3_NONDD|nr:hypothetical protein DDD_1893 [Nonlabens dokdonensis DSW-6]
MRNQLYNVAIFVLILLSRKRNRDKLSYFTRRNNLHLKTKKGT